LTGNYEDHKYRTELFVDKNGQERARSLTFRKIDRVENDVCRDEFILAKQILDDSLGPLHPRFADVACALAEYHLKSGLELWSKRLYEQACMIRRNKYGRVHPMTAVALVGLGGTYKNMNQWEKMRACAEDAKWIWEQMSMEPEREEERGDSGRSGRSSRSSGETGSRRSTSRKKKQHRVVRERMEEPQYHECEEMICRRLKYHPHRYRALFAEAVATGREGGSSICVESVRELLASMERNGVAWTQLYQDVLFEKETLEFRERTLERYPIHGDDPHDLIREAAAPIVEHTHNYFRHRTTR
jgi:hypothetical protein